MSVTKLELVVCLALGILGFKRVVVRSRCKGHYELDVRRCDPACGVVHPLGSGHDLDVWW